MRGEQIIESMAENIRYTPMVQELIKEFRNVCKHRDELVHQNTELIDKSLILKSQLANAQSKSS